MPKRILTARERHEMLEPWTTREAGAESLSLVDFFQWCAENHLRPNRAALEAYSQQSDISTQDFLNISNMLESMGLDGHYLEILRSARRMLAGNDPRKSVWSPEDHEVAAELKGRLHKKHENGELPRHNTDSPEHYTQALQEYILMHKTAYYDDSPYWAMAWDGWDDEDDDDDDPKPTRHKGARRFWAMPAPPPEGLRFTYDPHFVHPHAPADHANYIGRVNAYVGDDEVGRLDWLKKGNPLTIVTDRKPGEVNNIFVHPDYRRQSVATEMYDWAKKNAVPELHHSPRRTELGDQWVNYEKSRTARRFWASSAEDAHDLSPSPYRSSEESKPFRENTSGKWYHVSPHKLEVGTVLNPNGGESPYGEDHSMPPERRNWVWMDGPKGLRTWYYGTLLGQVKNGVENPWAHIYEVEPSEGPHPWNGTGWEGHAAPSAKIIREIETDKYNRLPDHLGHTKTALELSDEDSQMLLDYLRNNKIKFKLGEPEKAKSISPEAFEKMFAPMQPTGKWYHVSPNEMEEETQLVAGGPEGKATSQDFYDMGFGDDSGTLQNMGGGRTNHVWLTPDLDDAHFWSAALDAPHIYEVDPHEEPQPWNGTGTDGWVAPGASIRKRVSGEQKTALKYDMPEGISVTSHPFRKSKHLADELLDQDGPAVLWKALKDRWPGDHHYVARGEDGTIHGVLKGHWGKEKFYLSDLYSSLKAPVGTGNHLLRTVAQDALKQGKGLRVINMLNDARPYWEGMGAQTEYNNAHADWSPEGLQALVNGDTIMSPNTEGTMMMAQPIPREHRLPGSARQIAWGRRKLKSAGENGDFAAEWREARFWKTAEPMADAYDPDAIWNDDYVSPERAEGEKHSGPWYHITPWTLRPGVRIEPSNIRNPEWGNYNYLSDEDYMTTRQNGMRGIPARRQNWVWMTPREKVPYWMNLMRGINAPLQIYEVSPEIEGPWPYNGSGREGYVSPAATVIRQIPHKDGKIQWDDHSEQVKTQSSILN